MQALDLSFVRSQFPAFSEPSLNGWSFFENAGGSYACVQVIERLNRYYRETKVQPYAPYPASTRAGEEMDSAYRQLAAYLNVSEDEIHLGPSTSQNTFVLPHALRLLWKEGDEIIVTNQDHEANSGAWRKLVDTGMVVREWQVDAETGMLNLADLDDLLSDKTRMVSFPHCSNVIAHINPVAEIAAKVRAAGAISVVDGVSYAPHGFPDVQSLGADIYLFSLYKTYGPHQGLMVVRRGLLDQMSNQSHYFNAGEVHKKLVPAGPDHAQIAASNGVPEYFDSVYAHHFQDEANAVERGRRVHDLFREHEKALTQPLLDWLVDRKDVQVLGPTDADVRAPTIATITKRAPEEIAEDLAKHKIMASAGDFYAPRVIQATGNDSMRGVLRLSFVHYTSAEDIEQLIKGLDACL